MKNFAVCGVAGRVAPRHLEAIRKVGGRLVAVADPHDSAAVLDTYDLDVPFFNEMESFNRHLESLQNGPDAGRAHYLTVCSPNYLHDAHCRLGLRLNVDVICEKPIVVDPSSLDGLEELEEKTGHRIWTVLQLRVHERLLALRDELRRSKPGGHDVVLTYVTSRGRWYDVSWKGNVEKSGGVATNIGVHMFDLLVWLFGSPVRYGVHLHEPRRMAGFLELERARVGWFLSVDARDLPAAQQEKNERTLRAITIDGAAVDFSSGFENLHTRVYEQTLAGRGFGIDEARPSIELAHRIRQARVESRGAIAHPFLTRR